MTRLMFRKTFFLGIVACAFLVWGCAAQKTEQKGKPVPTSVVVSPSGKASSVSRSAPSAKKTKPVSSLAASKSATKGGVFAFGKATPDVSNRPTQNTSFEASTTKDSDETGGMKVGMQFFAPWRGHNFDTKSIVRMRGKVIKVKTGQTGMMFIVSILLETKAKGKILVDLGPLFYLRTKGMFLTKGNRLEVIGSLIRSKDGREKIVAVELVKGRRSLKFRDLAGTPLWANVQPRMWSPESRGLPGWSVNQGTTSKKASSGGDPNKPVVPNFDAPVSPAASGGSGGSVAGPPSWGNIQKRQQDIRSKVGSGVPTSIGN